VVNDSREPRQRASARRRRQRRQPEDRAYITGLNIKIQLAVDAFRLLLRVIVTAATCADCALAASPIEGVSAAHRLTAKVYDSDAIVEQAASQGMGPIIARESIAVDNRKVKRAYYRDLYSSRHLVENVFPRLKRWRRIATRYVKNLTSFVGTMPIR
jgi:transposase